ncbi:MAG: GntR family transcriptional regulator [Armatimonadota bacterium]|nr:GntR family transcriptional regulator [Armatimonadota bacterium]MDR7402748.1 GntR family transcriptional regulator [Armatimonadota bacterium]MDR7404489.1 GntR family transcriptional regulator [Armatimonadota bacterium]MDR7437008.1 GntR family transcriptional regulator [Armatimonadota bacterium]MDR7472921.1 GntR family transcriptional regulator [Armatimonadota bacterium]
MSDKVLSRLRSRSRQLLPALVRDALREWIADRRLRPGDRMPPEPALASLLGVSRATLREAIRVLEMEGVLSRARGVGTFVAASPFLRNNLGENWGVTDLIRSSGYTPGTAEKVVRISPGSPSVCSSLGLPAGAPVVVLERLRTADGRPVVLSTDIFSADLLPRREDPLAGLGESLYEWLRRSAGVVVHHGRARLRPVRAVGSLARRLRVRRGTPLLFLEQVDYTADGRPVLLSMEYHVPDVFEFTIHRVNAPAPAPGPPRPAVARAERVRP